MRATCHFPPLLARSAVAPQLPGAPRRRGVSQAGFTILEAGVAGTLITVFLTALFAVNSNMMHLLRASTEAANASQNLQQRVEQARLANWNQITDPSQITNTSNPQYNLFKTKTDASVNLPGLTETLVVSPYTALSSVVSTATPPPPYMAVRNPDGTIVISTGQMNADGTASPVQNGYIYADALAGQEMLRVDLTATWPSLYRTRTRTLSTLISRWGISK